MDDLARLSFKRKIYHADVYLVYLVFQIAYMFCLTQQFYKKHEYEYITTITIPFGESVQSELSSSELLLLHTIIVHVFWCPRQTQHLRFQTSFRPEDHIDWEMAPHSYDLQSSGILDLNEHLRIFYSHEPP